MKILLIAARCILYGLIVALLFLASITVQF